MNWPAAEAALIAWVQRASGLPDGHVIWAHQGAPSTGVGFVTLHLSSVVPVGGPAPIYSLTDLGRDAGEEVEQKTTTLLEVHLSLQATTSGVTGSNTARALLTKVQMALGLDSYRSSLDVAGLTPFDVGVIRSLPEVIQTTWTGRAVLEMRFYARESLSEFVPYIDNVELRSFMGPPDEGTKDEIDI